ncbi:hypothetical protein TNCV_1908521 [Trichonephila clavipes]|nr:hypothetical protein TNCV_1908521 [Trichonephila clavipes]
MLKIPEKFDEIKGVREKEVEPQSLCEGRLVTSAMRTGHIFVASRSDLAMSRDFVVSLPKQRRTIAPALAIL